MIKRRRVKQVLTLSERLEQEAARLRARAEELPPGPDPQRTVPQGPAGRKWRRMSTSGFRRRAIRLRDDPEEFLHHPRRLQPSFVLKTRPALSCLNSRT